MLAELARAWQRLRVRKRQILLICALGGALIVVAIVALYPSSKEPSYGGRPLRYWVAALGGGAGSESEYENATNAIHHIGVAALPFLVKWLDSDRPGWKDRLGMLFYRAGLLSTAERIMTGTKDQRLTVGTHESFRVLGARALPVLHQLGGSLMSGTNEPSTDVTLVIALSCFGTNALPVLLTVATNHTHPACWPALSAIGDLPDLGGAAQVVVGAITNIIYATETNNPSGQQVGVYVLGNLKTAPQISLPAIAFCLQSTDAELRSSSAEALGKFGTGRQLRASPEQRPGRFQSASS